MTVRRDLDTLAESGLLEKVHGGATARGSLSTEEPGFEAKSHRQLAEKEAIAAAAARLVGPGQAIGLTAGHDDVAPRSPDRRRARPDGRHELDPGGRTCSTASGGRTSPSCSRAACGRPPTRSSARSRSTTIRALHLDVLFLGVHGMARRRGLQLRRTCSRRETDRAFIAAARTGRRRSRTSTKWGVRGLSRLARLDEAHVLVDGQQPRPPRRRTTLEAHVERVVLAPVRGPRARRPGGSAVAP